MKKINCNFEGEKNGNAKLTKEQVEAIRFLYKHEKLTQRQLAAQFGICKTHARRVILGISWA
jgi:DNA-binding transcriptional regulator LsrR (DeoR family)